MRPEPPFDPLDRRHCITVLEGFKTICQACRSDLLSCLADAPSTDRHFTTNTYNPHLDKIPRHVHRDANDMFLRVDYAYVCKDCPLNPVMSSLRECLQHRHVVHGRLPGNPSKLAAAWVESIQLVFGSVEVHQEYVQQLTIKNRADTSCVVKANLIAPSYCSLWLPPSPSQSESRR
ncbi:hypothetical protein DFQ26_009007, partial [Actinomortierella ambigua]